MAEITILVVEPGKAPRMARTQNTVEAFEKIVGGPIDVGCFAPERVLMISNADAAADGLPPNRANPRGHEYIFGTFLLCGLGEDFSSLTPEQAAIFQDYFGKSSELNLVGSEKACSTITVLAAAAQDFLDLLDSGEVILVDEAGREVHLKTGRNVPKGIT